MKACTRFSCSRSVVRMKKSFDASSRSTRSRNRADTWSQNSFGESPAAAAACATLAPCSSVPVRKKTSSPRWRWWRASASAATVVYACPRCGSEFT